ncbi:two component system response regulator [Rhodococcus gordoniae]|uniref:Two component system response regulator n=1 Tax=Rhodococcus gordoniae TaxID=223392 RepID=A0A379PMG5_9NOCA|nr:response regulator [Rhodococcus gordoniae]SUF09104.1 two component system response regulator [Rhodococcus gordoniae]
MTDFAQPVVVLLVEDDPADELLTAEALGEYKITNRVHVVRDGYQALRFLHRHGPYSEAPRPDLILLDVHLPRCSGVEVLDRIRVDPDLRAIPVVMLTASVAEEDLLRSRRLPADAYIVKPVDLAQLAVVVRRIDDFFFQVVHAPTPADPR